MDDKVSLIRKKPMLFVGARIQFVSTTGDLF